MSACLKIAGLVKQFGGISALAGIDLEVERGSVLAVLGPNGAGKSTLFGCLLGLVRPTSGTILWDGRALSDRDRARFGYVAERVALYPHRTVAGNAAFFAQLRGQSVADMEQQLKRVGLYAVRERKIRQLSKGMLQRLGVAIALSGRPEFLVLDEPFNGLDPALLETLQTILREEQERGATLLISTHTMSAVEPLATHVAILLEGRLAAFGSLNQLREEYREDDSLESIYYKIARGQRPVACEKVPA
jgi:ABC-type multidrug transport system ATPase subunit